MRQVMISNLIVGWWMSLHAKDHSPDEDRILLDFTAEGSLTYHGVLNGRLQKIFLVYRIDGDKIVTDQPSSPREETTAFELKNDGNRLILKGNGEKQTFEKVDCQLANSLLSKFSV